MPKSIAATSLAKEIQRVFDEYIDEIDEVVKEEADVAINEAKNELKIISPKDIGDYAKSWRAGTRQKGKRFYSRAVYNLKYYRLTHLLEFGHINRDGISESEPKPHIRSTEEKYKQKFTDNVERKIRR